MTRPQKFMAIKQDFDREEIELISGNLQEMSGVHILYTEYGQIVFKDGKAKVFKVTATKLREDGYIK